MIYLQRTVPLADECLVRCWVVGCLGEGFDKVCQFVIHLVTCLTCLTQCARDLLAFLLSLLQTVALRLLMCCNHLLEEPCNAKSGEVCLHFGGREVGDEVVQLSALFVNLCTGLHLVEVERLYHCCCSSVKSCHTTACPCANDGKEAAVEVVALLVCCFALSNDFAGAGYHVPTVLLREDGTQLTHQSHNLCCRKACCY